MQRIGLLSDTHGFLDPLVFDYFQECDQIWHAGDFGSLEISEELSRFKPLVGVFGNIDDEKIRAIHPRDHRFQCENLDVWMTHIGGYPGRYDRRIAPLLRDKPPQLFICGHSHILRVMRDKSLGNMVHLNPGAAGRYGIHIMRTMLRFEIVDGQIQKLQGIELGPR